VNVDILSSYILEEVQKVPLLFATALAPAAIAAAHEGMAKRLVLIEYLKETNDLKEEMVWKAEEERMERLRQIQLKEEQEQMEKEVAKRKEEVVWFNQDQRRISDAKERVER
jgi:hypothetical protein